MEPSRGIKPLPLDYETSVLSLYYEGIQIRAQTQNRTEIDALQERCSTIELYGQFI